MHAGAQKGAKSETLAIFVRVWSSKFLQPDIEEVQAQVGVLCLVFVLCVMCVLHVVGCIDTRERYT